MPLPAFVAPAAISLGLKGLSSIFGGRSKKKKNVENKRAATAGLNIQQKQREDARRARLALAQGLLGRVPATTAGGGVNTNVAPLDPALFARLDAERTYDFGSAIPDENVGTGSAFLQGLFGGAADIVPYAFGGGGAGGSAEAAAGGPIEGLSLEDLMQLQRTQQG